MNQDGPQSPWARHDGAGRSDEGPNRPYGQDPYDPRRTKGPKEPIFNVPPIVRYFLGIFVVVHLAKVLLPDELSQSLERYLAVQPITFWHQFPTSLMETVISAITYQFLHAGLQHLLFNGTMFLIFGTIVARRLPVSKFIILFLLSGLAGAVVHLILFAGSPALLIGASGSIMGLLGAAARFALFPTYGGWQLNMYAVEGPLTPLNDDRLRAFVAILIVLNLVFGFFGGPSGGGAMAWDVHIAGLFAGLLLFPRLDRRRGSAGGSRGSHLRRVK